MDTQYIKNLIEQAMPATQAEIKSPDNVHFDARIISGEFVGKARLARHRMVHKVLDGLLGDAIHAMSFSSLLTPEEADKLSITINKG